MSKKYFNLFIFLSLIIPPQISKQSLLVFIPMQQLNPQPAAFDTKCKYQNKVSQFCQSSQCQHSPFLCPNQDCQCRIPHQECSFKTFSVLRQRLMKKSKSIQPIFEKIVEWFEREIEVMREKLEEAKVWSKDMSFVLLDDEKKLYNLLRDNKTDGIKSGFLSSVFKSLQKNQEYDMDKKLLGKITDQLKKSESELSKVLEELKRQVMINKERALAEKINPKFSEILHHPQLLVNGKILEAISKDGLKTALFEQSVEKFGMSKQIYKFRISKTQDGSIMLGFCHINQALAKKYSDTFGTGNGGYMLFGANGTIYMHNGKAPVRGQNKISKIGVNQRIEVIYNPQNMTVDFVNTTTNCRDQIQVGYEKDNPLHMSVILYHENDRVEFEELRLV